MSSLGFVFFLQWQEVAWTWYIGAAVILNLIVVYGLYYLGYKKGVGLGGIVILAAYFSIVNGQYNSGLDIVAKGGFSKLKGKNVGVVVNHTSVDQHGKHLIQLAYDNGIQIKAVFTPEHGFTGVAGAGEKVEDGIEPLTGSPIYSLYGKNKFVAHVQPFGESHITNIGLHISIRTAKTLKILPAQKQLSCRVHRLNIQLLFYSIGL